MAAVLLAVSVFLLVLAFVACVGYVVFTVREHMEKSPAAAKAIYDHVFLPVFVGVPEPEKPEPSAKSGPEIDADDFQL